MSAKVSTLKVGQQVEAEISEVFANGDALVSFAGELVRVCNQTSHRFQMSERLKLQVLTVSPLSFKWLGPRKLHSRLDVSV